MASFPSRGVVVVLLFLTPVYSADLDQELRVTVAMNQLALQEQSFALAQHSQALSQLLQRQEGNQLDSQGISQAVAQMALAITQLSQELSPLIQMNKELATQQSSSLTKLVQIAEDTKASQSQLAAEMRASQSQMAQELRASQSQVAEELRASQSQVAKELRASQTQVAEELTASQSQVAEELRASQNQTAEDLRATQTQVAEETRAQSQLAEGIRASHSQLAEEMRASQRNLTGTLTTLLNESSEATTTELQKLSETPPVVVQTGPIQLVSDGIFMLVKERMTWQDARTTCQEMGGDLATPPSDFAAFKTFVSSVTCASDWVWLGGREEGSRGYKYVDGREVNPQHWYSGDPKQPNKPNGCLTIHSSSSLYDGLCSKTLSYICRLK